MGIVLVFPSQKSMLKFEFMLLVIYEFYIDCWVLATTFIIDSIDADAIDLN